MASPITSSANADPLNSSFSPTALAKIAMCDLVIRICLICLIIIVLITFVLTVISITNFIPVLSPVYCLPGWIIPFITIAILNIHKHRTAKTHGFSLKDLEKLTAPQIETIPLSKTSTDIPSSKKPTKPPRRKKAPPFHLNPLFPLPQQHSDEDILNTPPPILSSPDLLPPLENPDLETENQPIITPLNVEQSSANIALSLSDRSSSSSLQSIKDLP